MIIDNRDIVLDRDFDIDKSKLKKSTFSTWLPDFENGKLEQSIFLVLKDILSKLEKSIAGIWILQIENSKLRINIYIAFIYRLDKLKQSTSNIQILFIDNLSDIYTVLSCYF